MFTLEKTSNEVKFHLICVNYKKIFKVGPEPGQSDGSGSETLTMITPYLILELLVRYLRAMRLSRDSWYSFSLFSRYSWNLAISSRRFSI